MGFGVLLHPQNRETAKKLGSATAMMFTIPILGFYLSEYYFTLWGYKNPDNYAGAIAIILTNIIIGIYCYSALHEDDDDLDDDNDSKKRPKSGKYKQRTD